MTYHISKELLFTDLTDAEADDLRMLVEPLVLRGYVAMIHPAFVAWCAAAGFDERQALLVYSTAFPQRALLSLLRRERSRRT